MMRWLATMLLLSLCLVGAGWSWGSYGKVKSRAVIYKISAAGLGDLSLLLKPTITFWLRLCCITASESSLGCLRLGLILIGELLRNNLSWGMRLSFVSTTTPRSLLITFNLFISSILFKPSLILS